MTITYPAPGRGSWRTAGGLLPPKPGSTSKVGYYRLNGAAETPVGSAWVRRADISHAAYCVSLGVSAIQQLCGSLVDGWFGPLTWADVVSAQKHGGVEADGIVGPASMKAFLTPLIGDQAATNGVPMSILGGLLVNESGLDPAAIGVNGLDHGLAQINLAAHPTTSLEEALDPYYAVTFAVQDLAHVHQTWLGRTAADPWDVAIANHNSPALARQWAVTGTAPVVAGRVFQIGEYVQKVRTAW